MSTRVCVSAGSGLPKPENISANIGTTNWMRPAARRRAIETITVGYVIALLTFPRRRAVACIIEPRRLRMPANSPDCSPATTMFTYMSSKSTGNAASPRESGSPPSIVSFRWVRTFLNSGLEHCSSSVWMVERMGMPAPIIEASCLVNGTTSVFAIFFAPFIFGMPAMSTSTLSLRFYSRQP